MRKLNYLLSLILTFALSTMGTIGASRNLDPQSSADTAAKDKIVNAAKLTQNRESASEKQFAQWYNWNNWSNWNNWRNW